MNILLRVRIDYWLSCKWRGSKAIEVAVICIACWYRYQAVVTFLLFE